MNTQETAQAIHALAEGLATPQRTPIRLHGYPYFSEHPVQMIEWYDAHMKGA